MSGLTDGVVIARVEALLARLGSWTGEYPHPDSSSGQERDRLRALLSNDGECAL